MIAGTNGGSRRHNRPVSVASLAVAGVLLVLAGPVAGHETVVSSDPAPAATLANPPMEVVITFSGELDPSGSTFAVVDDAGDEVGSGAVDLGVAERNVLRGAVAIEADGTYEVRWTAVAADGHPEQGSFTFSVGRPSAPNTALPAPNSLGAIGVGLLVAAIVAALRRPRAGRAR